MEKSNAVVEFIKILDAIRDRSTRDKPSFNIDELSRIHECICLIKSPDQNDEEKLKSAIIILYSALNDVSKYGFLTFEEAYKIKKLFELFHEKD